MADRFCAARGSRMREETTTAVALPNRANRGERTRIPNVQAASGSRSRPATASMPAQNRTAAIQVIASAGTIAAMLLPRMMLRVLTRVASSGSSVRRSRSPPMDCAATRIGRKMGRTRNIGSHLTARIPPMATTGPPGACTSYRSLMEASACSGAACTSQARSRTGTATTTSGREAIDKSSTGERRSSRSSLRRTTRIMRRAPRRAAATRRPRACPAAALRLPRAHPRGPTQRRSPAHRRAAR